MVAQNEKHLVEVTEDYKKQVKLNMQINIQNQKLEKIVYGSSTDFVGNTSAVKKAPKKTNKS